MKLRGEWFCGCVTVLLKFIGVVNVLLKFKCDCDVVLPRLFGQPLPLLRDLIEGTKDGCIAKFYIPVPCPKPCDVMLPPVPLMPSEV